MSDECRGDCRVMTAVSNDPEMGNVEMTFREALEMYVSRTHNLEAALAAERTAKCKAERERDEARAEAQAKDPAIHARKELTLRLQERVADAIVARDALWQHYRRCTDALGLRFDEVPENPEKELEMWQELRAKVVELEADRERLDWLEANPTEYFQKTVGWSMFTTDHDFMTDPEYANGKTLREAIDAAREAAKGEVKRS